MWSSVIEYSLIEFQVSCLVYFGYKALTVQNRCAMQYLCIGNSFHCGADPMRYALAMTLSMSKPAKQ